VAGTPKRGRLIYDSLNEVRGWTTTQAGLVTAASFRTWPGWRGACPRQPLNFHIVA